jgi:hypothetical protein
MMSVSDRTRRLLPTALAGLGTVACVAGCALPLLLATAPGRWRLVRRRLGDHRSLAARSGGPAHRLGRGVVVDLPPSSAPTRLLRRSGMFLRSRMTDHVAATLTVGSGPCWS